MEYPLARGVLFVLFGQAGVRFLDKVRDLRTGKDVSCVMFSLALAQKAYPDALKAVLADEPLSKRIVEFPLNPEFYAIERRETIDLGLLRRVGRECDIVNKAQKSGIHATNMGG